MHNHYFDFCKASIISPFIFCSHLNIYEALFFLKKKSSEALTELFVTLLYSRRKFYYQHEFHI